MIQDEFENQNTANAVGVVRRQLLLSWVLMLILVGLLLVPWLRHWLSVGVSGDPRPVAPRGALADFERTTVDIFREASPSVVFITTRTQYANRWTRRIQEVETGTGSGFVWDEAGHIVTNYHVVEGASSARVVFSDQSAFEADLVGTSPDHDLAVLRIKAPKAYMRPVLIGESGDLQVGQSVFAIGNPFGLQQTLTAGIVSAKSRSIRSPSNRVIEDVIQIDAAINPGNSGGPLLDSAGRLIGVNTAIYSPSGTSAGVGFSIPVDTVNRIVPEIVQYGRYEPPQLGIYINDEVSRAVTERLGTDGVVVFGVEEGGPAAQAGLKETEIRSGGRVILGDIILQVGERTVNNSNDVQNALQKYEAGDTVQLRIRRNQETLNLEVQAK